MIRCQILQTNLMRIVWQTVRRIANEILGVKGLKVLKLIFYVNDQQVSWTQIKRWLICEWMQSNIRFLFYQEKGVIMCCSLELISDYNDSNLVWFDFPLFWICYHNSCQRKYKSSWLNSLITLNCNKLYMVLQYTILSQSNWS